MPYENIPEENAPAIPARPEEYTFTFDLEGYRADGTPRSTIDDLELFSPENQTTNKQMLDYLDRVVTKVARRGEVLTSADGTVEGVRGKTIPFSCLKQLMTGIGEAIKAANSAGN